MSIVVVALTLWFCALLVRVVLRVTGILVEVMFLVAVVMLIIGWRP